MKIFIVIPAYQEEERIGNVIKDVIKTKFPIIVVDDGSKDNTFKVANRYRVTALGHRVNLGKGAAMKTGAEAAFEMGAEAIVFMDSDGQHKIEDLSNFIDAIEKDKFDVVFGSRHLAHGVPLVRYLGNKIGSILVSLFFGIYVSDLLCGFRAVTKKAYNKINWESTGYAVETEMVIKTGRYGLKHCEVSVETVYLDSVKGVTLLHAFGILLDVIRWRIRL